MNGSWVALLGPERVALLALGLVALAIPVCNGVADLVDLVRGRWTR